MDGTVINNIHWVNLSIFLEFIQNSCGSSIRTENNCIHTNRLKNLIWRVSKIIKYYPNLSQWVLAVSRCIIGCVEMHNWLYRDRPQPKKIKMNLFIIKFIIKISFFIVFFMSTRITLQEGRYVKLTCIC